MSDDPRALTEQIMRETRIAVLTHIDDQGRLVSVPMGTQDFDDPSVVWFISPRDTDKVRDIAARPEVNLHYAGGDGWVSVSGHAHIDEDRAKLRELWDTATDTFMEGGPDDPETILIRVEADTAAYWAGPGKVATAVELVKARVTDQGPDLGESGTVDL